jgi:hypothetical protein
MNSSAFQGCGTVFAVLLLKEVCRSQPSPTECPSRKDQAPDASSPAMNPESPEKNSLPPAWLRWFVSDASRGIIDDGSLPPIGCHYFYEPEQCVWEVTLFIGRTEVVGGPRDGNTISSGLQVDVCRVINAFDDPPECYWQSEAIYSDDQLGNHLSLEGMARGHHVWLRILHHAPDWTSVSRLMHSGQGVVEDLW